MKLRVKERWAITSYHYPHYYWDCYDREYVDKTYCWWLSNTALSTRWNMQTTMKGRLG